MNQSNDPEWADLGNAWLEQHHQLEISEHELQARLRHQCVVEALLSVSEWLGLAVALGVTVWMSRYWLTDRYGLILFAWLLVQAVVVLWMRRGRQFQAAPSVLDHLDASIERDDRLVESLRLGNLMGLIALAAAIVAVAVSLRRHSVVVSVASLTPLALLFVYVFAVQIAILVYARRVRRRRKRFEAIRRALRALE